MRDRRRAGENRQAPDINQRWWVRDKGSEAEVDCGWPWSDESGHGEYTSLPYMAQKVTQRAVQPPLLSAKAGAGRPTIKTSSQHG